jgi:hypothetical protein
MLPIIVRPMQQKWRVGLYAENSAGLNLLHLPIEFPDFNRLALALMSNISVVNWLDQIKDSALGNGTMQFYIFGMRPDQGHRCISRSTETKMTRGHVRCVPDLLGDQANTLGEVLQSAQIGSRVTARSDFIVAAFAR